LSARGALQKGAGASLGSLRTTPRRARPNSETLKTLVGRAKKARKRGRKDFRKTGREKKERKGPFGGKNQGGQALAIGDRLGEVGKLDWKGWGGNKRGTKIDLGGDVKGGLKGCFNGARG